MANPVAPNLGTGTTILFESSGFQAEWEDFSGDRKVGSVDTTHLATAGGYRTSIPLRLRDPGKLQGNFHLNPSQLPVLMAIIGTKEYITLTYPVNDGETVPATSRFQGWIEGIGTKVQLEVLMSCSATIAIAGAIVDVAGS